MSPCTLAPCRWRPNRKKSVPCRVEIVPLRPGSLRTLHTGPPIKARAPDQIPPVVLRIRQLHLTELFRIDEVRVQRSEVSFVGVHAASSQIVYPDPNSNTRAKRSRMLDCARRFQRAVFGLAFCCCQNGHATCREKQARRSAYLRAAEVTLTSLGIVDHDEAAVQARMRHNASLARPCCHAGAYV